jgi:hypothetical protein
MTNTHDTDLAVQYYLDTIQKLSTAYYAKHFPSLAPEKYYIMKGRKYHRVVQEGTHSRSVHAFIGADGLLYKAESWASPAKDPRYNLLTDMAVIAKRFDPHGSYLYKEVSRRG